MSKLDPRIAKAIEFDSLRALRFMILRVLVLAVAIAIIAFVKSWLIGVPVGLVALLFVLPEVVDRTLLREHRAKAAALKADPSRVVWVHYWAHGEKICPVFVYDRNADFAVLHLPSGYARPLLDAFRARAVPPLITTTDEEKRIVEPRQKFLGRLHELEARVTSAPQPALQALAAGAVATIAKLHERYGTTLDATEGRDGALETVDRLLLCYDASLGTREPNGMFNAEIVELLKRLET